jgi:hypothetical protein
LAVVIKNWLNNKKEVLKRMCMILSLILMVANEDVKFD